MVYATNQSISIERKDEMKEKVAAYCRVSTDKTDQKNSLSNQKEFFMKYIQQHEEWELVKIYVDKGITGTSTKHRKAFHEMMEDAHNKQFTMLVTKEISRFARNTLDSIYYTRQLKEYGVGVYFLTDQINTLDADAELRLTILASLAQEESRKTSERVRWGQTCQMEQGIVFGHSLLGYQVHNGRLIKVEEEAKIVQMIFDLFLREKKGTYLIAKYLREHKIPTPSYMKEWSQTSIYRILKNEKYCGDLVQKKTVTTNYLTHARKKNDGEQTKIVIENHHEPIITKAEYELAQKEFERRSKGKRKNYKYSNRYALSGKLTCTECGAHYVARKAKRKGGKEYLSWRCYQAKEHKYSTCKTISQQELEQLLKEVVRRLPINIEKCTKKVIRLLKQLWKDQEIEKAEEYLIQIMRGKRWSEGFYQTMIKKLQIGPYGHYTLQLYGCPYEYSFFFWEVTDMCRTLHIVTPVGTEELAHMEIISAIVYQLTKDMTPEDIEKYGFEKYYVDHTLGLWPQSAGGVPFSAQVFQSKGDPITDLHEDMAAEQKARTTYDNILRLVKDPDICDPIRFLREREVVHFQRFGEALRITQDNLNANNFYAINPAFDLSYLKKGQPSCECNR